MTKHLLPTHFLYYTFLLTFLGCPNALGLAQWLSPFPSYPHKNVMRNVLGISVEWGDFMDFWLNLHLLTVLGMQMYTTIGCSMT